MKKKRKQQSFRKNKLENGLATENKMQIAVNHVLQWIF